MPATTLLTYMAGICLVYPDHLPGHLARSISWVFLFIAGWMCTLSRNNIKRAAKYAVAALVVWVATTLVSVDDSVNFGIIFCMAACTAIVALARPVLDRVPAVWGIAICLILFACTWSIPKADYPIPYLAWLGFPGPDFVSGDYYPLIPFLFMYLTGFFAARTAQKANCEAPAWPMKIPSRRSQARTPCTAVLPASSTGYLGCTGADLFRSVTLKTWCDTGRKLCHNTNAVLEVFLVQKGSLFVHERD